MITKSKFFISAALAAVLLAGCGQDAEEQADNAVRQARDAFELNRKEPTEQTGDIQFYKPAGWKADMRTKEHAFVLTKGKRTLTAEYDPTAAKDSRAYYELLAADAEKPVLGQETFADAGAFGFVVISKQSDELVEVVAGTGPAQVKAIVGQSEMGTAAEQMMEIARSLEIQK